MTSVTDIKIHLLSSASKRSVLAAVVVKDPTQWIRESDNRRHYTDYRARLPVHFDRAMQDVRVGMKYLSP